MSIWAGEGYYIVDPSEAASSNPVNWEIHIISGGTVTASEDAAGVSIMGEGIPNQLVSIYKDSTLLGSTTIDEDGKLLFTTSPGDLTLSNAATALITMREGVANVLASIDYTFDSGLIKPYIESFVIDNADRTATVTMNKGSAPNVQFKHMGSDRPHPTNDATVAFDLGQSVDLGSTLVFVYTNLKIGDYEFHNRSRWTYDEWTDNGTCVVKDGRFEDIVKPVSISAPPQTGTQLIIPAATPYGSWTDEKWSELWGGLPRAYNSELSAVRSLVVDSEPVLETRIIPNGKGSPRISDQRILSSRQGMRIQYDVMFMLGFKWGYTQQAGKLGFGVGKRSSILEATPGGGRNANDACSLRDMYQGNGSSGPVDLAHYYYGADKVGTFSVSTGEYMYLNEAPLEIGKWYTITKELYLNTSLSAFDGIIRGYLDGDLRVEHENRRMISIGSLELNRSIFDNFKGGNSEAYSLGNGTNFMQYRRISIEELYR